MGNWFNSALDWLTGNETWLNDRTQGLCDILQHGMEPCLDDIKEQGTTVNDNYNKQALNLNNPKTYQGKGAQAFLSAVDADINKSRPLLDSFGHATSAAATLRGSISDSSHRYDGKIASIPPYGYRIVPNNLFKKWRDKLIETFFANMTNAALGGHSDPLSDVLQNGSATMGIPWSAALKAVEAIVSSDADQYASTQFDPSVALLEAGQWLNDNLTLQSSSSRAATDKAVQGNIKELEKQFQQQMQQIFMDAFNKMSRDLHLHISNWAGELHTSYTTFQSTMRNLNNLTARDLFDFINGMHTNGDDGTQGTNDPITITPYKTKEGKQGLLITIAGTDLNALTKDTSLFDALQTGQGSYNPYQVDVENALLQYLREHPEMDGAELTFAGYSLGGMTAQETADDIANGNSLLVRTLRQQYGLHTADVITYGSPVMGAPLPNVKYAMYGATYDPIPLLSSYENPILGQIPNPFDTNPHPNLLQKAIDISYAPYTMTAGAASLVGADVLPWNLKHAYIDPTGQYGGQIHNISDVGNTILGQGFPVFSNHMQYQNSNQLNAATTATTDIKSSTLGPTEYFGMSNTNNAGAEISQSVQSIGQGMSTVPPNPNR